MRYLLRPLTDNMIAQLKAAHAIETSKVGRNICNYKDFQFTFRGLYRRGFIDTRTAVVSDKEMIQIYITDEGKSFLKCYNVPEEML